MKTILCPQEIYLLERFTSPEYFCELRDTWEEMVTHLDSCLNRLAQNLPKNYRAHSLTVSPDMVWKNKVLPNFKRTLQGLHTGYILLTQRNFDGLRYSWGATSDFKGQMDFWSDWMERADENIYGELLNKAVTLASNISRTERAGWEPFDLAEYGDYLGPLNPPAQWPVYRIQGNVSIATGRKLERSGIYVPDVENSCAEFLSIAYETAPSAQVRVGLRPLLHPTTGERYAEEPMMENRDCIWYLIERAPDEQGGVQNRPKSPT